MKKFLLFSFLLLIGACSSVTWGQHTETFGNATWTVDDLGIITSCTNIDASGVLTVPNTVDNIHVNGFADHLFRYNTTIRSLDFSQSNNVFSLSVSLCEAATNLDSVNFGSNITSIGANAFYGCTALRSAVLPNSVTTIGSVAFKNCTSIKLIKISSSIENSDLFSNVFSGAFANANDVTIIWGGGNISAGLFQNYAFLKKFVTESGSRNFTIDANAFQNCGNLETIQLTSNVSSIGSIAFKGCSNLKNITIATTATAINNSCFTDCSSIENIVWCANSHFPAGIFNSSAIKTVTFRNTDNINISASAFSGKTNLETVDFGQNIASIENHAFDGCIGLSTISLPNSVTSIGEYAFNACTNLSTVTLSSALTTIGKYAFSGCTNLSAISLPSNLTTIGEYAFNSCTGLSAITWPNSVNEISKGVFDGCTALTSVDLASVTTIDEYAFRGCGITTLTIPSTLTALNPTAFANVSITDLTWNTSKLSPNFANNTTLTSVTFGNSGNLTIGNSAFSNCSALTTVNFGDHISSIGAFAFDDCHNLNTITLPEGLTSVGSVAFRRCGTNNTNGVTLTIPKSLETLDAQAFYGTSIVNLTWKSTSATLNFSNNTTLSSVTFGNTESYDIPDNAFQNCTALTTVVFGQHINAIGDNAFYGCENLDAIVLPEGLLTIGNYAFKDCCKNHSEGISLTIPSTLQNFDATAFTNVPIANLTWNSNTSPAFPNNATLTTVTLGNTAEMYISNGAFQGCTSLTTVDFGDNVTSIGNNAFYGCENLGGIELPEGLLTIGNYAFKDCCKNHSEGISLTIPSTLQNFDATAFTNVPIANLTWNSNTSPAFPNNATLTTVTLGNTTDMGIAANAFQGCTALTNVNLGRNITSIGNNAFDGCSMLSTITLPEKLTTIGNLAFHGCTDLETVNLPTGVTVINDRTFDGCGLTSIDLANVTSVGDYAFRDCDMTELTIPSGLTNIASTAFSGVPVETLVWNSNVSPYFSGISSLLSVTFGNTVSMELSANAFYECTGLKTVDLGNNIGSIEEGAFRRTAIEEIVIPASVASIDQYAFRECNSLEKVTFMGETAPTFVPFTFTEGYADKTYYVPCEKYGDYTIADNTPCNANNTIEDCSRSENSLVINSDYPLTHTIEYNKVSIERDKYTYPTISLNNHALSANKLSIDWTFDAHNYYYFTLPFDCDFSNIEINDQAIASNYIIDWSEALKNDEGGWQILRYDNIPYITDQNSNKTYPVVQKTETLKAGVGYVFGLLNPVNDPNITVVATFNNANGYTFNIVDNNIDAPSVPTEGAEKTADWNLYGNPFYWNIPVSNFSNNNNPANSVNVITPAINGSQASVIRNQTGSYSLKPGEMFFYQVGNNDGITISATPAPASSNAPARYSNQHPLRLTLSHNNTNDDHMFISSDIEASDRYVIGEDCAKMKNAGMNQIYTMINDTIETAFNCLNLEENVRAIPVGLTIENAGEFEIALDGTTDFMPGTVLKLRDTQTGAEYNLLNGPATLTLAKGITDGRYVIDIRYIPNGDETVAENASFSAFIRDGRLVVEGIVADDVIRVYDAAGRMVTSFTANSDAESLNLNARGVYFVNVNGETIKVIY